jgi:Uncharacterized protein conserved in bacteria
MSILSPSPDAATLAEIKIAQRLCRGVCRLFEDLGYAALTEFPLANGRRVDVIALDGAGGTAIIEIKSSVTDFRTDRKWQEYLEFCDRFYFAVAPEFPQSLLPADVGSSSPMIGRAPSFAPRRSSPSTAAGARPRPCASRSPPPSACAG